MRQHLLFGYFLLLAHIVAGQTVTLSGVFNRYATVVAIDPCHATITVDSPGLFTPGQQALLIQMQGAQIDTDVTHLSYGDITALNGAGNYEIVTIQSITAATLHLSFDLLQHYDTAGSVQLIPMPQYQSATINKRSSCKPWNGSTGGVWLLNADTIVLQDTVDVSGRGFRGYLENDGSGINCFNPTDEGSTSLIIGAPKGEGITKYRLHYGCGKNANGGGGGNDHNSGGAGGGNWGKGGDGGKTQPHTPSCKGDFPGVGGLRLLYQKPFNQLYMGGAGGCGDGNNNLNTGGTNGGGIVIMRTKTLIANGHAILANGINQDTLSHEDGSGGGGAGGTVAMEVTQVTGSLTVVAHGGNGGRIDQGLNPGQCWGPGGGGGGGGLWVSTPILPATVSLLAAGGPNGFFTWPLTGACAVGTTNGALPGDSGGMSTNLNIPVDSVPHITLGVTYSPDTLLCSSQTIKLSASAISSDSIHYLWNTGASSATIQFFANQSGSYNLFVVDKHGCSAAHTYQVIVEPVQPLYTADEVLCVSSQVTLSAFNPPYPNVKYQWSIGATTDTVSVFIPTDTTYTLTVTSPHGCSATHTFHYRSLNYTATFTPDTTICPGQPVRLSVTTSHQGFHYHWITGDTIPVITVVPTFSQHYFVILSDSGCSVTGTTYIGLGTIPATITPDTMICKGDATTLSVQAVGVIVADYHWSTGLHSASIIATPTTTQTYSVTVTDIHGCMVSVQTIVSIDPIFVTLTATPHALTQRGDTVQLASSSLFHTTHQWSGDSIFAYSTDSTQAYAAPAFTTIYCVTVSDTLHCTARGCDSVIVPLPDHIMEIPTAFTPNGDGINDRYRISALRGISVTTLRIYNRWGQMVYVGDNTGWDGSYQGLAQPAGTYSCEVEYHITSDPERGYAAMSSLLLIR